MHRAPLGVADKAIAVGQYLFEATPDGLRLNVLACPEQFLKEKGEDGLSGPSRPATPRETVLFCIQSLAAGPIIW